MSNLNQNFVSVIVGQLEAKVKNANLFESLIIQYGRESFLDHMAEALAQCTKVYEGFTPDDSALTYIAASKSCSNDPRTAYRKSKWAVEQISGKTLSDENVIDLAHASPFASAPFRSKIKSNNQLEFLNLFNARCEKVKSAWFLRGEYYENTYLMIDMIDSWKKVPGVKYAFSRNGIENNSDRPMNLTSVHEALSNKAFSIESMLGERGNALTPLLSMINNVNSSDNLYGLKDECNNILRYSADISKISSMITISDADRQYANDVVNKVVPEILKKSINVVLEFRKSYCSQPVYDVMASLKKVLVGISIINSDTLQPNCSLEDDFVKCLLDSLSDHSQLVAEAIPTLVRIKAVKNKDYLDIANAQWKCEILSGLFNRDQMLSSKNRFAKSLVLETELGM